ncbi:MAG: HlyD family secretion protein [Vicinamibacterales bacterium]
MRKRLVPLMIVALIGAAAWFWLTRPGPDTLVLTGLVTTDTVIVSPQVGGRLTDLRVAEGDAVTAGEVLGTIDAGELTAERAYYDASAQSLQSQVAESEAALRLEQKRLADAVRQAEASVATAEAEQVAAEADLGRTRVTRDRTHRLADDGLATAQQVDESDAAFKVADARVRAAARQADAARAALAVARANAEQVAVRRSQVAAAEHQRDAAGAQRAKADVRLGYSELRAPVAGIVDVRAARQGEVVGAGQPVVTLLDPDDLWVRVDVEETYIDRVRLGDTLTVRLPSGEERTGTVILRKVDGGFATQRDVSRTKRDIRTFEVRLRVDNADRRLAVGMTTYVLLPVQPPPAAPEGARP